MSLEEIVLKDNQGLSVTLSSLGAAVRCIKTASGEHLALCYDNQEHWQENPFCLGATVGRVANRIARGRFTLGGRIVQLACNSGDHHLHGGFKGLSHVPWVLTEYDHEFACFTYASEAADQGYPARVLFRVEYRLEKGHLSIDMHAEADAPTPISMTNHIYWNLSANESLNVFDHHIMIPAAKRLLKDEDSIANGEIITVRDTEYDFRMLRSLEGLSESAGGFDDFFIVDGQQQQSMRLHAQIRVPNRGLGVDIYSNAPGCQFYTGFFLKAPYRHVSGERLAPFSGLCIEPHEYPNAVNHAHFPRTIYGPARPYHHRLRFDFQLPQ